MIATPPTQQPGPDSGRGWQWDASVRHIVLLFAAGGNDPDAQGFRVRVGPCPEMPTLDECAAQVHALLARVAGTGLNLVPITPEEYASRHFHS